MGAWMLSALLVVASLIAGLVKAPWWFWLLAGVTMALISATDPKRLRVSNAEVRGLEALPLLLDDLKLVTRGFLISALAFAAGSSLGNAVVFSLP